MLINVMSVIVPVIDLTKQTNLVQSMPDKVIAIDLETIQSRSRSPV